MGGPPQGPSRGGWPAKANVPQHSTAVNLKQRCGVTTATGRTASEATSKQQELSAHPGTITVLLSHQKYTAVASKIAESSCRLRVPATVDYVPNFANVTAAELWICGGGCRDQTAVSVAWWDQ